MAQRTPTITFEDIPLDKARRISRGPRMDPERSSYSSSLLGSHNIRRGAPDDGGDTTKHHGSTTGDLGR